MATSKHYAEQLRLGISVPARNLAEAARLAGELAAALEAAAAELEARLQLRDGLEDAQLEHVHNAGDILCRQAAQARARAAEYAEAEALIDKVLGS